MKKVLIDKGFLLALIDENNTRHLHAVEIINKIKTATVFISSTDYINFIDIVKSQYSNKTTYKLLKIILKQKIFFLFSNEEIIRKANNWFINNQETNLSYLECLNLILFEKNEIDYIVSFSENYQGKLLPLL